MAHPALSYKACEGGYHEFKQSVYGEYSQTPNNVNNYNQYRHRCEAVSLCFPLILFVFVVVIVVNLDSGCIFFNVTDNIVRNRVTFSTGYLQQQLVQVVSPQDVNVIGRTRSSSRIKAFRFVGHLDNRDLDACWVVTLHIPAMITHVTRADKVDSTIALAHNNAMVHIPFCKTSIHGDIEVGS